MQEGSNGVINETEAESITATANVIGFTCNDSAAFSATGNMTNAAAALLIGCVSNTVSSIKPNNIPETPIGLQISTTSSARNLSAPEFVIAVPKAVMPVTR